MLSRDGFFRLFQVLLKMMMYGQVFISLISPVLIGYLMLIQILVNHDWQRLRIGWAGVWGRALHQGSVVRLYLGYFIRSEEVKVCHPSMPQTPTV